MPTVARRRDRVRDEDTAPEEEEPRTRRPKDEDEEEERETRRLRRRRDEEEDDDDDELEDTRATRSRRRRASQDEVDEHARRTVRRANRRDEEDDDDEDEDERPARRRSKKSSSSGVPEGVRSGWDGADQTASAGGGGDVNWLKIGDHVELVKFLEDGPVSSFRQHWIEGGGDDRRSRPYLCPGSKCPVCGQGDKPSPYYIFNVLHLSGGAYPEVKALQINQSAYKDLTEVFHDRKTGKPVIDLDFASIKKSGKGFQTRTKFTKVKDRDLEDDWDEIFEPLEDDEKLEDIIEDAQGDLYTQEQVSPKSTPRRELEKLAKYLDEPEDD